MQSHDKKDLYLQIDELARIEYGIRPLAPKSRDHVVHALLSYILGIYLNERFMNVTGNYVDPFQWKLAGLFHDIGYPVELSHKKIVNEFVRRANDVSNSIPKIRIRLDPGGLLELSHGINSLELIQNRLNQWELDIDAEAEYNGMLESSEICHGIISALTLLHIIDAKYTINNPSRENNSTPWNQNYFEEDIVSACSAIFLHNLPEERFLNKKIDIEKAPLAFLLKVTDCLQDWDRPFYSFSIKPYSSSLFDIDIEDGRVVIFTSIDSSRRDKLRKELDSYTSRPEIIQFRDLTY